MGAPRLANQIALITGAGSGIGRATALLFAEEGAKVAATDVDLAAAQETAAAIEAKHPGQALALAHDVALEAQWQSALDAVAARFGGLTILVNNAGIPGRGSIEEIDYAFWQKVHRIDLDSVFLGCKHAVPRIAQSGGGAIVNVSSVAGIVAGHNLAAYNSAKAAVRHLSKSVALHCAKQEYNIRCNSVHPAFVKTPILADHVRRFGEDEAYAKLGRQIPLGIIGEPLDVAYAILFLAGPESRFITGTEIILDGGLSAQ
ncbi:MAG: glucose 1-dehydrogenase [Rhodospirillales bacterium]|nr:glucose 1-dehydrogenase [Rhodospirillales bacterium]